MKQAELNRQVAQQLGETVAEIARRGFILVDQQQQDSESDQVKQAKATDAKAA